MIKGSNMMPRGGAPMPPLRSDDSRGQSPGPKILETNVDFPPLTINGDIKGPNGNNHNDHHLHHGHLLHHHHHHHHSSADRLNDQDMHLHHAHDLHHHTHDCDAETATPTDTMLTHPHKFPLPEDDDDDEDDGGMTTVTGGKAPYNSDWKLQKVAQRHGLTKKGLVLLCLLGMLATFLLVVLLILVAMWPRENHQDKVEVCLTPDCLRASAQLQGNLNPESAPCENFWDYTCGGWLEDNPIPPTRSKWSVQHKLKYQALGEMRELLDTMDEPEDVNSIEWKLKTFYWSCMNVRSYMKSGLELLRRKIITELHGWTLMRETWDMRRWEFDVVLTKLHAMYGVSPFFQVTVVPNPRKAGHNIIKLLPSGFAMPHRSYYDRMPNNEVEMAYKQYIKDTVKLFDASGPDAIEFAAHLFHYESRIAEFTPSAEHLEDPHASNILISIGELSQIARSVPWLDLLRKMFPNSKLDHRTDVIIVSRNYFSDLSELISTTDRGLLNNYLIFSFVTAYMPYLSADNKRVLDLYQQEFTGMREPMERWEFCIQTTNKFFGYGLGSLYERNHNRLKAREKNIEVVHGMFNQIRNTLGYNLANSRWYPLETKEFLVAKLNNMSVAVGYPKRLLNPAVIDEYYKGYTIFTKDFFQNLQDSIRNAREQMELKLIDPMPESEWMEALSSDTVTYQQEANKIVIPTHLLNAPFFHRNYPNAMLYGGLGVKVGRKMLESMDSVGLSWNARGQLVDLDHFTNRSLDNMRGVSECVGSATLDLALEEDAVVIRTAKDTAAEIDAVRQTYQAYLHLMRREPQPQHPSFENLNTTNIFFMAYSTSACSDQTVQQEDISRTCSISLMPKPRLEAVLSQMPEFSDIFECPPNSRHSPHTQCTPLH